MASNVVKNDHLTFNIIDAPMGAGKSTAIINMVKSNQKERFLSCVPLLTEVDRYCQEANFLQPKGFKSRDISWPLYVGANTSFTHSLFMLFNDPIKEMIAKRGDYKLIIDEELPWFNVFTGFRRIENKELGVIEQISGNDFDIMREKKIVVVDDITKAISWNENSNYEGVYKNLVPVFRSYDLFCVDDKAVVGAIKKELWEIYQSVTVCTYRYNGSFFNAYCDFHNIKVQHSTVMEGEVVPYESNKIYYPKNFERIHPCQNEEYNFVGNGDYSLSKSWFIKASRNPDAFYRLRNDTRSFFRSKEVKASAKKAFWTTFKPFTHDIAPFGYSRSFIPCNTKATNDYGHCTAAAYLCNIYPSPYIIKLLALKNISVDQDHYALSTLLQFLYRGAVRNGEYLNAYIPSKRLRTLLLNWIINGKELAS